MSRFPFLLSLTALFGLSALYAAQTEPGKGGKPYLGVYPAPAKASGEGVAIREVSPDSPAAKAGLKDGDVVFKVNSKDVPDVAEFLRAIGKHKPGDKVTIQVQRKGLDRTIPVTLGTRPADLDEVPSAVPPGVPGEGLFGRPVLGVKAEELTPDLRKKLRIKAEYGVLVLDVKQQSPAAKAGVERDDVIVAINGKTIKSPEELTEAIRRAGSGKVITLRIHRQDEEKDVKATLRPAGVEGLFGPGRIAPGGPGIQLPLNVEGLMDQSAKIRELERRVDSLEKKLKALDKGSGSSNK